MNFRLAEESDIPAILSMYDDMFGYAESGEPECGWKRGVYPCEDTVRWGIKHATLNVFAEKGVPIAAFSIIPGLFTGWEKFDWQLPLERGKFLTLHAPIIAPHMRGRGIGGAIVDCFEMHCFDYGYKIWRIVADAGDLSMGRLYTKFKYRDAGRLEWSYNGKDFNTLAGYEKYFSLTDDNI